MYAQHTLIIRVTLNLLGLNIFIKYVSIYLTIYIIKMNILDIAAIKFVMNSLADCSFLTNVK